MAALVAPAQMWYARLAHARADAVIRRHTVVGCIALAGRQQRKKLRAVSDPCLAAKQTRTPLPMSITMNKARLKLVHVDVCGPLPVLWRGNASCFLTVYDDCSGSVEDIPISLKSNEGSQLRDTIASWEAQTGLHLRRSRTYRGGEYMRKAMKLCTRDRGVIHDTTAPNTPDQHGNAEPLNRTILEKVGIINTEPGCTQDLLDETVATVAQILKRVARTWGSATAYELWCGKYPSVHHFRTFVCKVEVLVPSENRRKLAPRGEAGILVWYEDGSNACSGLVGATINISRDFSFEETRMEGPRPTSSPYPRLDDDDGEDR